MSEVDITSLDPGHYGVQIREGTETTHHRVRVPPSMIDDLGLFGTDEERIVRESVDFLLDREPMTSILRDFSLDQIPRYFPEYYDELQARLAG